MARSLRDKGYEVKLTLFDGFGAEDNLPRCKKAVRECDVLVLPLPVSRNGKTVNAPYSEEPLYIAGLPALLRDCRAVFGGMIPFSLAEELSDSGIKFIDYYKDELLITKNAYPTAEGVLGIMLKELPITVRGSRCLITGFGRCGKATARLLMKNGCDVTVSARSPEALAKAAKLGCGTLPLDKLGAAPTLDFDAVVNTIPHRVLSENILKRFAADTVFIEIASAPFGIDFDAAEDLGLKVIKAASLPGKYSPKTAGIIIADSISAALERKKEG